ncbi:hypothetical protein ACGF5M_00255 [Gemmatimonadota bacterium]
MATLNIDPKLLCRLREHAAREGRSAQSVANDLLRDGLARLAETEPFKLVLEGWEAEVRPGVDLLDRNKLFDHLDSH